MPGKDRQRQKGGGKHPAENAEHQRKGVDGAQYADAERNVERLNGKHAVAAVDVRIQTGKKQPYRGQNQTVGKRRKGRNDIDGVFRHDDDGQNNGERQQRQKPAARGIETAGSGDGKGTGKRYDDLPEIV